MSSSVSVKSSGPNRPRKKTSRRGANAVRVSKCASVDGANTRVGLAAEPHSTPPSGLPTPTRVFVAPGATDMRKSIDGLSALVAAALALDPLSAHWFVFCNRGRDKLKILFWDHNGFWLWYRRLEKQRFWWPERAPGGAVELSVRELGWLIEGLDPRRVEAHRGLGISSV